MVVVLGLFPHAFLDFYIGKKWEMITHCSKVKYDFSGGSLNQGNLEGQMYIDIERLVPESIMN